VLGSLLAGVLLLGAAPSPGRAAEQLEVRIEGLSLPIDLAELEAWSRDPGRSSGELAGWLSLLDANGRAQLLRVLRAPLVTDRSFTQQFLASWAGQRVLDELDDLISTEEGEAGPLLYQTLNGLLRQQRQVTTVELLRALPSRRLILKLDGGVQLASQWRQQLLEQGQALRALRALPLPEVAAPPAPRELRSAAPVQQLSLAVPHRREPLPLRLRPGVAPTWVLLSPGLGGSSVQLDWLAAGLQRRGWSVVLVDHPGSDELAVRELLEGRRPPPGAETLRDRVLDLQAVVQAVAQGPLPPLGQRVVLMGHSLGAVSALLAAGLRPEPGLAPRCRRALKGIPLTNLSQLLQCQLTEVPLPPPRPLAQPLAAVVSLHGFGSLLWPQRGLRPLKAPALLLGGSLDLITPPLDEQLALFLPEAQRQSRLVVVDGGSHFSPVRIASSRDALFRLGDDLVGVDPQRVQALTLDLSTAFLDRLASGLPPQRMRLEGVEATVLDSAWAQRWWESLRR
jgi:predicted dienelactone hydrolase